MINKINDEFYKFASLAASTVIIGPINTIYTSLQLSVKAHKYMYGAQKDFTEKGLIKLPNELTLAHKRKIEAMAKVGS